MRSSTLASNACRRATCVRGRALSIRPDDMLHLFALGELRLETDAGVVLSRRRKPLVLLVFLARRAPRPASRVELAALLWGERPDAKARQSLRQALLDLHHLVGDRLKVANE